MLLKKSYTKSEPSVTLIPDTKMSGIRIITVFDLLVLRSNNVVHHWNGGDHFDAAEAAKINGLKVGVIRLRQELLDVM